MNSELLLALGLALGVVVLAVVVLRRGKRRPGAAARPLAPPPAGRVPTPLPPPVAPAPQPGLPPARDTAAQIDAQRQAATEALRLARQRKAEEAARLQAQRERQARADAQPQPQPRPAALAAAPEPGAQPPQPRPAAPAQPPWPADRPILSPLALSPSPSPSPSQFGGLAVPVGSAAQAPSPGLAPLRRLQPARPPLVLLADDSKVVRVKTGRLLEKQGWQVLLADDGEAALQALDTHAPDLLITDVEMPGIDGFELTRQVRAHARFARLPVIMITSSDTRHRAEANAAGVNLLLGKPYAEETLLAQVKAMLDAAAQRAASGVALH